MAVLENRRIAQMPHHVYVGAFCDGEMAVEIFFAEQLRMGDKGVVKDQQAVRANIVLHLIRIGFPPFGIAAKLIKLLVDPFFLIKFFLF